MPESSLSGPTLSRRSLLKVGIFGSAVLTTAGGIASLSGCSVSTPANGFRVLRSNDLSFLRTLVPVVLAGTAPATQMPNNTETTLQGIDYSLSYFPHESLKQVQQLFDLLTMAVTRGPLTGIWGRWEDADNASVHAFIQRWENSSVGLLNAGAEALKQLPLAAWYAAPGAWAACGYPGPPTV